MYSMKKVCVIGAGISGLSSAIYAARAGFDVTIYEKHISAGGLSTNWSRKGYLFEGGMHWLTGSSEKLPINKIWREVGALQENNPIYIREPFYVLQNGKNEVPLYRDVKKLHDTFLSYSPEDKRAIENLCRDIKLFTCIHILVDDIPFLKAHKHTHPSFWEVMTMGRCLFRFLFLVNQSYENYLSHFKNADIRHLLATVIGRRYNALSFIYTLAAFASGDCGYPTGGSKVMTQNMLDTFLKAGGKIEYKSTVSKVVVENKKVQGVVVNDKFTPYDSVIVTQDTRRAIEELFDIKFNSRLVNKIKTFVVSEQNMFVSFGVKANLKNYPRGIIFPLDEPLKVAGIEYNELRINNYALYENHSPENCTSLTCLLLGNSYSYWKFAKEDGTYKQKKDELAQKIIERLEKFIPEIKGNIEVIGVATPLTYERYCSTYQGGWMSVWEPGKMAVNFPHRSITVQNLYFAGQRMIMPGGLPCAVLSGRKATQYLCRDNHVFFN